MADPGTKTGDSANKRDLKQTKSAYCVEEDEELTSFCSETISWYDERLRKFNGCVICLIVLCLFMNSYAFFFKSSATYSGLDDLTDILYVFLVFLRSRTGHMIDGVEERNLLKVRERYQTSIWFILDMITLIPYSYLKYFLPGDPSLYRIIDKQKTYLRLHYVLYFIGVKEQEPGSDTSFYRVSLYLTLSSVVIHFFACGWYGLACSNMGYSDFTIGLCTDDSWMFHSLIGKIHELTAIQNGTLVGTYAEQVREMPGAYISSLYWASATSFSTGFGDIHAHTILEKIFSTLAMLLGLSFLYGMTVSGITSLLINNDARRAEYVHYYNAFKQELNNRHLKQNIKDICLRYCNFIWYKWQGTEIYDMAILPLLPEYLQTHFAKQTFKPLLQKAQIFAGVDDAFLTNLARKAKHTVFLRDQFVQRRGEIPACMCFVRKGVIEILDTDENEALGYLKEGDAFGNVHLVCNLPRLNSLRCTVDTEVFMIQRYDFAKMLLDYPQVLPQIMQALNGKRERNEWPMQLTALYTDEVLDKYSHSQDFGFSIESGTAKAFDAMPTIDPFQVERRIAVSTEDYEGIDITRAYYTACSKKKRGTRGSLAIGSHDVEGEETEKVSFWKQLESKILIEPDSRFRKLWELYMLVLAIGTYNMTAFVSIVLTSLGRAITYTGEEVKSLPLLDIAKDGLYSREADIKAALETCNPLTDFDEIVDCIKASGGHMSRLIYGNSSTGYTVTVPNQWDLSFTGMNIENTHGIIFVLICYFIIDLSFYINVIVNLCTKVVTDKGTLDTFKDIRKHYMTWGRMGNDLIVCLPIELFAPGLSSVVWPGKMGRASWWAILRANRLLALPLFVPRLFLKLERSLDVNIVRLKLTQVIVYILSLSHTLGSLSFSYSCSCVWKFSKNFEESRIYDDMCVIGSKGWKSGWSWESGQFDSYMFCLYYVWTITTSTGYGEIPCTTRTEMVYAMVIMAIGTTTFGWLIAVIASMLSSDATGFVTFMNSVKMTKNYLVVHSVPSSLIKRVSDCRHIQWCRYRGSAVPGVSSIGEKLPNNMEEVFNYESTAKYIEALPIFKGISPSISSRLSRHVEVHYYSEGDVIIYQGDMAEIHVIKQGHCRAVSNNLHQILESLHPGDCFGELETLHGLSSLRTVMAETTCEILILHKADIFKVFSASSSDSAILMRIVQDSGYEKDMIAEIHREETSTAHDELKYPIQTVAEGVLCYGECLHEDPSYRRPDAEDNTDLTGLQKVLKHILLPITFDPSSKIYIIYETVRVVLTFCTLILVPLQIAFLPQSTALLVIQYLLDALCLVDQYIKLHTMFYNDQNVLVYNPLSTAARYLKTGFFLDFISWFPFEIFVLSSMETPWTQHQWKFFACFRLLRVFQILKLSGYFKYWMGDVRWKRRWVKHLSSVVYTMLLHHWVACMMFSSACQPSMTRNDYNGSEWIELTGSGPSMYVPANSWFGRVIADNGLPALTIATSLGHRYLVSLYWASATLVCVGYGDLYPVTAGGRIMSIMTMLIGLVYYGLILGDLAANLQMDDNDRANFKKRLVDIKRFFKLHAVSKETEKQVISYYCYLWERTRGVTPNDLLEGLPPALKTSVCQSMYDQMLREAFEGLNKLSASEQKDARGFFRLLSTKIEPHVYLKGSVIFSRDDVAEEMYFIQRGNVALYEDDDTTIFKVLGPGQFFGAVALFNETPRERKAVSLTNCDLNILSKQHLQYILKIFPQFESVMKSITEDRQLMGSSSKSFVRKKSNADVALNVKFDEEGNRVDGSDKLFFSKIVDCNSFFASFWENGTVLFAFLSCCLAIYQAAFLSHGPLLDTLVFLLDAWFILDMVICFHTSFHDRFGNIVDIKEKIHEYYGKNLTKFCWDCCANAPIELFGYAAFVSGSTAETYALRIAVISYLRLNRVFRIKKLVEIFMKWEADLQKDTLTTRMYKCVLGLCFSINLFASIFYFVACPGGKCGEKSWTTVTNTDYRGQGVLGSDFLPWVDGCYWVVATMTTTGYGDIKPETPQEICFSCIVMVAGKLIVGYILSILAATLANDDHRRVWYEERVKAVCAYMGDMSFDTDINKLVMRYYEYMWMKNQGTEISHLFEDLCYSVRADVSYQMCGDDLAKAQLFEGCSQNFLCLLCTKARPVSFMPGDYIEVQGNIGCELFVVYRGVAETYHTDDDGTVTPLNLMYQGDVYVCGNVFKKVQMNNSVRARTYVDVFFVSLEDIQECLTSYPRDKDILFKNAEKIYTR